MEDNRRQTKDTSPGWREQALLLVRATWLQDHRAHRPSWLDRPVFQRPAAVWSVHLPGRFPLQQNHHRDSGSKVYPDQQVIVPYPCATVLSQRPFNSRNHLEPRRGWVPIQPALEQGWIQKVLDSLHSSPKQCQHSALWVQGQKAELDW